MCFQALNVSSTSFDSYPAAVAGVFTSAVVTAPAKVALYASASACVQLDVSAQFVPAAPSGSAFHAAIAPAKVALYASASACV